MQITLQPKQRQLKLCKKRNNGSKQKNKKENTNKQKNQFRAIRFV